jgi:hypothetical protein
MKCSKGSTRVIWKRRCGCLKAFEAANASVGGQPLNGFFTGMPPARDWFYGVRTFAASMIALYIAMLMQMPRPYWAMATVYIVSSPFVGPTSSKALYRAVGTLLGAAAAVFFVPMFVQSPYVLVLVIALWTGILLFLSHAPAHRQQLRLDARRLHLAADRPAQWWITRWRCGTSRKRGLKKSSSASPWRRWSARCSGRGGWRRCSTIR